MGSAAAADVVIGGRVLDVSAVLAFAEERSVYASAACAAERGWPLLTAHADRYRGLDGVGVEELP